jgi:hypothetical protein
VSEGENVKAKEWWLADAKAKAREIWREQNRALARRRTEALERLQPGAVHTDQHVASGET